MSYILDALKRAESERERGSIPGLHVRHVAPIPNSPSHDRSALVWLGAAVLLLASVGGAWWWHTPNPDLAASKTQQLAPAPNADLSMATPAVPAAVPLARTAPPAATSAAASKPKAVAASLPATAVKTQPAATLTAAVAPKAVTTVQPTPKTVAPASAASPGPAPAPVAVAAAVAKPAITTPSPAAAHPATATTTATPTPAGANIPMLSELPEALRRQIPALTISGAVYSDEPSQRLLLVNNLAVAPGNSVAPGVQLEEIHTNRSTFNFQGTRFQLEH